MRRWPSASTSLSCPRTAREMLVWRSAYSVTSACSRRQYANLWRSFEAANAEATSVADSSARRHEPQRADLEGAEIEPHRVSGKFQGLLIFLDQIHRFRFGDFEAAPESGAGRGPGRLVQPHDYT